MLGPDEGHPGERRNGHKAGRRACGGLR
jgi:hypothetical protein